MIPYDMLMKLRNKYVCANDGVWIQLVDRAGHPIPETEIDLTIDANSGRRIVYRGEVMPRGYYETCVKTGADGKAYVPIKLSSCREARFKGFAITSNGVEQFDGTLEPVVGAKVGRREPLAPVSAYVWREVVGAVLPQDQPRGCEPQAVSHGFRPYRVSRRSARRPGRRP